jgi:hypothetical protein
MGFKRLITVCNFHCYIFAARNGLSESELEDILSCDDDVLNDVYQYWNPPLRRLPPLMMARLRTDLQQYLGMPINFIPTDTQVHISLPSFLYILFIYISLLKNAISRLDLQNDNTGICSKMFMFHSSLSNDICRHMLIN